MKEKGIKIVTNYGHLLYLASLLGKAKKSEDQEAIEKAQKAHDVYKELCMHSDKMTI